MAVFRNVPRLHLIIITSLCVAIILLSAFKLARKSELDLSDPAHFHYTKVNVDKCTIKGDCPTLENWLYDECSHGHEKAVKDLLRDGANGNALLADGTAAIHVAVVKEHFNVVKILLNSGVDINLQTLDNKGRHDMFTPPAIGWTALHIAAIVGNEKILTLLLSHRADIKLVSIEGLTALHRAAEFGHAKITKILISAGADIEARSLMGATPIIQAANGGFGIPNENSLQVVEALLGASADVNATMIDGRTALWVSVNRGRVEIVRRLLNAKASSTARFGDVTVMDAALRNANPEVLQVLLLADVPIPKTSKEYPRAINLLYSAARDGNERLVELLLRFVDANSISGRKTPLQAACRAGHIEIVEILLQSGADPNLIAEQWESPLYSAASQGFIDIVKILLGAGAKLNLPSVNGETALHGASCQGHSEICELLLHSGAEVNAKSTNGETPLHKASKSYKVVEILLSAGANVHSTTSTGRTPLHNAAETNETKSISRLLSAGADINAQTSDGETSLYLSAKLRDSVQVVKTLLVAGANVHLKTSQGKTAISIAIENRNTEIVELLLGAGSETPDEMGKITLWESSAKGYYRVVAVLLDKGQNVNERVTRGWTCLHIAASNGHAKVVELLLKAGADKTLQDDDGRTALMLAKSRGHQDVVDLLSWDL